MAICLAPPSSEPAEFGVWERMRRVTSWSVTPTRSHYAAPGWRTELRRLQADTKIILSSGYNEQEVTSCFVGKGLAGFLQKPYEMATLHEKLREILNS